jgi:hypothetical protein
LKNRAEERKKALSFNGDKKNSNGDIFFFSFLFFFKKKYNDEIMKMREEKTISVFFSLIIQSKQISFIPLPMHA